MVPYYQIRHERQTVGLDGPDLAEQRRRALLAGARGTPRDSIQQFDSTRFHVASESSPGSYYEIDLSRVACNCRDFPRSRFCKHLAAIYVHFPQFCTARENRRIDLQLAPQRVPISDVSNSNPPQDSVQKLKQDIKFLSQELEKISDESRAVPAVMEAFRTVKSSLTAAIASTQSSHALPNREVVPPNQNSWTETAERMVWKPTPKHRLPGEHGITERSIGAPKGKRKVYTDPYAAGERSGKRAKPDALSAEANARARAQAGPPPSPLPNRALLPQHAPSLCIAAKSYHIHPRPFRDAFRGLTAHSEPLRIDFKTQGPGELARAQQRFRHVI